MNQDDVRRRLESAIQKLLHRDRELLVRDVNERSITHRLAMYLQEQFTDLDVDCEYNRCGFDVKRLNDYPMRTATNDTNGTTVFPDIIVHKRSSDGPNLLVIEAKKRNNPNNDHQKLQAFKDDPGLRYEHAVFVVFSTEDANPGMCRLTRCRSELDTWRSLRPGAISR